MVTEFYHSNRRNTSLLRISLLEEPISHNQSLDLLFVRSESLFSGSDDKALSSFHQSHLSNFWCAIFSFLLKSGNFKSLS